MAVKVRKKTKNTSRLALAPKVKGFEEKYPHVVEKFLPKRVFYQALFLHSSANPSHTSN
jgi:hypothetical protein